jgi:hypothetical protein
VTDIFFSYSSADRERVRPVRDALVAQGFEVFWDQQVPAGVDWDTWIRQHLAKSKCAMVFWSAKRNDLHCRTGRCSLPQLRTNKPAGTTATAPQAGRSKTDSPAHRGLANARRKRLKWPTIQV